MKRRSILSAIGAAMALPGSAWGGTPGQALTAHGPLTLMVAGPAGGQTCRWGRALALAMSKGFSGAPTIVTTPVGGLDGVTGANQLDTLMVPDGSSAAILPGATLTAYLLGDVRVHYDPTKWTPVLAGFNSGVLMLRAPRGTVPTLETLRKMAPLRFGAASPQSSDLAALMALARLDVAIAPVFGLHGSAEKTSAFIAGTVDAVFICGEGVPEDLDALIASGAVPAFCLGIPQTDGTIGPDPLFPTLALANALGPAINPMLDTAYMAAAAAARLDFMLVLPHLTAANEIAQWRSAATQATQNQAIIAASQASSISLQSAFMLASMLATLTNVPTIQPQLLAFLTKTYGWQPD